MNKIILTAVLAFSAAVVAAAERQTLYFDHGSTKMTQPHKKIDHKQLRVNHKKPAKRIKKQDVRKRYYRSGEPAAKY